MFSAYRRDDFADPDGFVLQLGMVLERYPDEAIAAVTSPITGIQRRCKQPPTIAEVVSACDGEVARAAKLVRYRNMGTVRHLQRAPADQANLFIGAGMPGYEAMVEWTKTADRNLYRYDEERYGIHVPLWAYQKWNSAAKIRNQLDGAA